MANAFRSILASSGGGGEFTLTISCSPDFAGLTITATDGITTLTETCSNISPYTVEFNLPNGGTWTISGTVGGNLVTHVVVIPMGSTLYNTPKGSTALPINDIQTWLNCGDIWDKSYTMLSEVLSDTTTLSMLVSNKNAVDYMVRSTSWVGTICANETAMQYIGENDYCLETLLADSTWLDAIVDSAYMESVLNVKVPVMTDFSVPSGTVSASGWYKDCYPWKAFAEYVPNNYTWVVASEGNQWIQYRFDTPKKIYVAKISNMSNGSYLDQSVKNFKVLCSYDGVNYSEIYSGVLSKATTGGQDTNEKFFLGDNGTRSYWKVLCIDNYGSSNGIGLANIQFYGRV